MPSEQNEIAALFDEFYLISEPVLKQPVKTTEIPEQTNSKLSFIGRMDRKTLVVFEAQKGIAPDDMQLLEKMITNGLKWQMDEVCLLNLADNDGLDLQTVKAFFKPAFIIFWGCDDFTAANKIPFKMHEVVQGKEMRVLRAYDFSYYTTQPNAKKALWEGIKNLVGV